MINLRNDEFARIFNLCEWLRLREWLRVRNGYGFRMAKVYEVFGFIYV